MNADEKLKMVKTLLDIAEFDTSEDSFIKVYLTAAEKEIISWRYSLSSKTVDTVPAEYEMTQIFAVIAGYSQSGAEGQTSHSENSISRTFSYPDMLHYIRKNVIPFCGLI